MHRPPVTPCLALATAVAQLFAPAAQAAGPQVDAPARVGAFPLDINKSLYVNVRAIRSGGLVPPGPCRVSFTAFDGEGRSVTGASGALIGLLRPGQSTRFLLLGEINGGGTEVSPTLVHPVVRVLPAVQRDVAGATFSQDCALAVTYELREGYPSYRLLSFTADPQLVTVNSTEQ